MERGDHSSRSRIAPGLEQPTRGSHRGAWRRREFGLGQPSPPIWPCSTRGFPCPGCCHPGGGLLPHLFTLAKCARPKGASPWFCLGPAAGYKHHRRSIFCGTCPIAADSFEVTTTGVRTFLPLIPLARNEPAITQLIRRIHYTRPGRANSISRREVSRNLLRRGLRRRGTLPCRISSRDLRRRPRSWFSC